MGPLTLLCINKYKNNDDGNNNNSINNSKDILLTMSVPYSGAA